MGEVAIGQYEPIVKHLRAALANGAPDAVIDSLLSQIRNDGLDIQRGPSGDVTLVRGGQDDTRQKVQQLVDARNAARKARDFKESDRIRDELAKMGVVLKDSKDGTTWEVAR